MTNFDLEEIYEVLSYVRFDPSNPKNIVWLDKILEILKDNDKNTVDLSEIFHGEVCEKYHVIIQKPYVKIIVEDEAVYEFFRFYLLEIRHLCLTKRYRQVFYLIDMLDNFPEEIIKNNLLLPTKMLKKSLTPYWRKYDKSFLKDFIRDIKRNSKSLKTK
ncbi:MAG: hypothetical protein IKL46_00840 [Clostridia bacterium]|nr:hypothetical protein [Alphaproteobacteria bacterium]MBR3591380.1 hypothetical protein [Clostridia bacterium]